MIRESSYKNSSDKFDPEGYFSQAREEFLSKPQAFVRQILEFDIDEIEEPCDCVDAIYDLANDFFDHIGEQSELESGYTKELKSKIRNIKNFF